MYGVARQMLSLVAGGAIDEYILSQLRALRQEHQLARLIHSLQITLWPGGTWFQRLPERQQPVRSAAASRPLGTGLPQQRCTPRNGYVKPLICGAAHITRKCFVALQNIPGDDKYDCKFKCPADGNDNQPRLQPTETPQPRFVMTPEAYLTAAGPKALDEDEIKEAVRELLMSSAPPALIRVIGRTAYQA